MTGRHITTLTEALADMTPLECQFFEALDKELRKVSDFYREREKEALIRVSVIKEQLSDLKDHRKIFRVRILIAWYLIYSDGLTSSGV
jgi:SPX domain protein involved in polyphosphate accumulation